MVKMLRYGFALCLLLVFSAPLFAQGDYPTFQLAPGYGNLKFGIPTVGLSSERHSDFIMDTNYNFHPVIAYLLLPFYGLVQRNIVHFIV